MIVEAKLSAHLNKTFDASDFRLHQASDAHFTTTVFTYMQPAHTVDIHASTCNIHFEDTIDIQDDIEGETFFIGTDRK